MKRILASLLILCLLCCYGLSAGAAEDAGRAVISGKTADRVHLRAAPSEGALSKGLYFTGTEVVCISQPNPNWSYVQIGAEYGYMKTEFLAFGASIPSGQPAAAVKTGNSVNLRSGPSANTALVTVLYNGDGLTLLGETAEQWYYVRTYAGATGYLKAGFVNLNTVAVKAQNVPQASSAQKDLSVYQQVMENKAMFLNVTQNRNMFLNEMNRYEEGVAFSITGFAVADVDQDGAKEAVIKISRSALEEDYLVLDAQAPYGGSPMIYGYEFPYRAMKELKADGTFSYSGSAFDGGIGYLYLNGATGEILPILDYHADENGVEQYLLNGVPVTESVFSTALLSQDQKQDAKWLNYTNSNIQSTFAKDTAWAGPQGYHPTADWPLNVPGTVAAVNNPNPAHRLNLRMEPNEKSTSLGKYYNGVQVQVLSVLENGWAQVLVGGLFGYMKMEFLTLSTSSVPFPASVMPVMRVSNPNSVGNLHLRSGQSTDTASLGLYPNGTQVILMGFNANWAHVIVNGQVGFMMAKYLK